jgi:ATP-binding cassette subfamily C protein
MSTQHPAPAPVTPSKKRSGTGIFLHFASGYPGRSLATIGCLLLSGVAEGFSITLFLPLLQRVTGGDADAGGRLGDWFFRLFEGAGIEPGLPALLGCIIAGMSLKGLLFWAAMNQTGFTVSRVATDLRLRLLRAMTRARWDYFTGQPSGQFANAIASEALKAAGAYQSAAYVIAGLTQLAVYALLAFLLSWPTALAGLAAGSLFVLLMHRLIGVTRAAGKRQAVLLKSVTGRIVDMLHGLKPVKAMGREAALSHYLEAEAEGLNAAQRTEVRAAATVAAAQEPVMTAVMAAGLYVILTWKLMPLSALLVQAFLFSRLFNQVNQVIQHYQRLVSYEGAFDSLQARLEEARGRQEPEGGLPAPKVLKHGITLRGIHFRHADIPVLADVDLDVPARRFTALTGPSGSGKTTLLDLIAGLQSPQKGAVRLDGQPLAETSLADWRRRIGYVPQEMLLLHDTVLANITLGETDIPREAVEKALRDADAWDFIGALPQGLDTPVGERGTRLSGGQRQRIALARALVRAPELLILDEATASLDPATEAALCRTLTRLSRHTTIVAVSHQPAVAEAADLVYEVRDRTARWIRGGTAAS